MAPSSSIQDAVPLEATTGILRSPEEVVMTFLPGFGKYSHLPGTPQGYAQIRPGQEIRPRYRYRSAERFSTYGSRPRLRGYAWHSRMLSDTRRTLCRSLASSHAGNSGLPVSGVLRGFESSRSRGSCFSSGRFPCPGLPRRLPFFLGCRIFGGNSPSAPRWRREKPLRFPCLCPLFAQIKNFIH